MPAEQPEPEQRPRSLARGRARFESRACVIGEPSGGIEARRGRLAQPVERGGDRLQPIRDDDLDGIDIEPRAAPAGTGIVEQYEGGRNAIVESNAGLGRSGQALVAARAVAE